MLRHFLDDFLSSVPLQLPQLLDVASMAQPVVYDDYALLTFSLSDAYELEEVMDMLEDDMELIILYHHVPSRQTRFGHSTCAYANPAFGRMFKINAQADDCGLVHSIAVTIYASLEMMNADLSLDLRLHELSGHFIYKKPWEEVLIDFIC